jgi:hypothetical protein
MSDSLITIKEIQLAILVFAILETGFSDNLKLFFYPGDTPWRLYEFYTDDAIFCKGATAPNDDIIARQLQKKFCFETLRVRDLDLRSALRKVQHGPVDALTIVKHDDGRFKNRASTKFPLLFRTLYRQLVLAAACLFKNSYRLMSSLSFGDARRSLQQPLPMDDQ